MNGRIEAHAHFYLNGSDFRTAKEMHAGHPDEETVRRELAAYKKAGIHFVRDGGDRFGVSVLAGKIAPEYDIKVITPVFAIHKENHYGHIVGKSFRDMAEYRALVKEAADSGADFIKIMTTGIMDFKTADGITGEALTPAEVSEMVRIAHGEGFRVMSHTNGADHVKAAVEAGVDSVEHGNFQTEDSLACMAQAGTLWVPTTVTVKNLIGCGRFCDDVLLEIWRGIEKNIRFALKKA